MNKNKLKEACFSKKSGKAEIIVFILYLIGVSVIACFHEPWFDEAQAWQIAKCSSLYELIFEVPHYEGHPPLWHMILAIFAKSGAPFELSLKAVNITLCGVAVALLLFRSPFPKIIRCIIPFTYFFFYQFAIVCRPYCIMMVAFFLSAITYRRRNEKPVRYILSLSLLCLASAYGILFAGGLCVAWVWEIFCEYRKSRAWGKVFRDARPYALLGILILALFLGLHMLPAEDCYYPGYEMSFWDMLGGLYFVFCIPFDALFGAFIDVDFNAQDTLGGLVFDCLGGAVVMLVLILLAYKNKKLLTFMMPYTLYIGFTVLKYVSVHHIGGFTLFVLFTFWIMLEESEKLVMPDMLVQIHQQIESPRLRSALPVLGVLLCCVPIWYSVSSCVTDIRYDYGPKPVVEYIREHHLENRKWLARWNYGFVDGDNVFFNITEMPSEYPEIERHFVSEMGLVVTTLPYFDENFFINFNLTEPGKLYLTHKEIEEYEPEFRLWEQQGLPDFILGYVPLDLIYDEETLEGVKYVPVAVFDHGNIWKLSQLPITTMIYIREDLLDEYPDIEEYQFATILTEPVKVK